MMHPIAVLLLIIPSVVGLNITSPLTAFTWIHGNNGTITVEQLNQFLKKITFNDTSFTKENRDRVRALNGSCPTCYFKCEDVADVLARAGLSSRTELSLSDLETLAPRLLYRIQNPYCYPVEEEKGPNGRKPTQAAMWGYSLMMVTVINCCALLGFTFTPFMGRRVYKLIMAFMIALAVGSLAGSAVLFLLPDALRLSEMEALLPDHISYVWKSTVVMGGVYMFFLLERFLKYMIERKGRLSDVTGETSCSMNLRRVPDSEAALREMPQRKDSCGDRQPQQDSSEVTDGSMPASPETLPLCTSHTLPHPHPHPHESADGLTPDKLASSNGAVAGKQRRASSRLSRVAPVAWMIIFGDGVHNFIDGLSIGAAFSQDVVTGFSLSVAVLCEELPHELGDFAILLNSGMSMKMALLFNFLSACMCYLGLIIGILVGEHTESAVWIFALAAGMFLYISLVDMLPEVNHLMESDEAKAIGRMKIFVIQNIGLYMGYGLLLLMAVYGGNISF